MSVRCSWEYAYEMARRLYGRNGRVCAGWPDQAIKHIFSTGGRPERP